MSEPSETSGRPLTPTNTQEQHPEGNNINSTSSSGTKHRESSQLSDDQSESFKSKHPRRRPGTTIKALSGPHAGSSRSEQRSTASPTDMMAQGSSIHYTRTGRISKAKKGLKVHNCECGRSYTRAEHLRRHQKNHAQEDALVCEYPDCGKIFYRGDLLHRHQERHNDPGQQSPHTPVFSPEVSPDAHEPIEPVPVSLGLPAHTQPLNSTYYPRQPVSPAPEPATIPSGKHTSYPGRHLMAGAVPVESMTSSMGWNEPYSQSPISSGYASPNPGFGDYGNMYSQPYGHSTTRTRTSSVASFNEPWSHTPRSPTSSASTMPYTWAPHDKLPPALAYMGTYPMASLGISAPMDTMSSYGHYGPKTMMQRDEDEGIILFPEQPYGMGQIEHTYPSEHYLNNYWRLFYTTFPIVHRHERISPSPMLRAAMIAIGGQYSNDPNTKRKSRKLHDRCIKLLERREREPMVEPDRLCDHQAVFLVEVLSQYRARRAAKALSPRFDTLYHKATENFRHTTAQLADIVLSLAQNENVTLARWLQWIELSVWQRLAISCYILESQQATLLAREPLSSRLQVSGVDLPFPAHTLVWDALNLNEWASAAQHHSSSPQYVYEVTPTSLRPSCDAFQSSLLIAAYYNRFNPAIPYASTPSVEEIDQVVEGSFATQQKLLTAKLLQVTPIRALLAISGESWILSEKVPSQQAFTKLKTTLRTWVTQLWSAPTPESQHVSIKEAIRLSIQILQLALNTSSEEFILDLGVDMGLYFAALVLWAATAAVSTRAKFSQEVARRAPHRNHSLPPSRGTSFSVPPTPTQMPDPNSTYPATSSSPIQANILSLIHSQPVSSSRHDSLAATTLLSHDQIALNSISFLSAILSLLATESKSQHALDTSGLQSGCVSLLLWVKLQLRGASVNDQDETDVRASRPGEGLGELLDSVIGSLERLLNRGWTECGI